MKSSTSAVARAEVAVCLGDLGSFTYTAPSNGARAADSPIHEHTAAGTARTTLRGGGDSPLGSRCLLIAHFHGASSRRANEFSSP